jgi:hypothetical protein
MPKPVIIRINNDAFHFHIILAPRSDECPICLEKIRKHELAVGHVFNRTIIHMVHYIDCWKSLYASRQHTESLSCCVCRVEHYRPTPVALIDHNRRVFSLKPNGEFFGEGEFGSQNPPHLDTRSFYQKTKDLFRLLVSRLRARGE